MDAVKEFRRRFMLKVHAENLGRVCVLHFEGRIVIGEAIATLRKAVLAQAEASAVVFDLAHVELIDARGLGLLLELRAWTQLKGIELRLVNVNQIVQHVLEITRLDTVFEMSPQESVREKIPSLPRRLTLSSH
jgi:anti-anti-sigma factor